MSKHFCISIHFLNDEFHGRGDHGQPEWPPSPLRLFQALVATNARLDSQTDDALLWFEQQLPPIIIAPKRADIQPRGYKTYVPDNVGDLVAKSWSKGNDNDIGKYHSEKFIRPTLLAGDNGLPVAHYLWPITEPQRDSPATALIPAVRATSQFGWGIDLVVADASVISETEAAAIIGERWLPTDKAGGASLRVPVPGTLTDLKGRYAAFLDRISLARNAVFKPVPPLTQFGIATYRRESEMSLLPYTVFALRKPDDSGFAAFSPTRRALHLSGMLRHAAKQKDFAKPLGWDNQKINEFVLGHGEEKGDKHAPVDGPRLVFIPLPSIEWRGSEKGRTVGAIRRVLVTVKGEVAGDEFARIVRSLEGRELIDEKTGQPTAFLRRQSDGDGAIEGYFAESSAWATITPVILPGYDDPGKLRQCLDADTITPEKKKSVVRNLEKRISHLLRKALRQDGYPEELIKHARLEWRCAGFITGTDMATNYAVPNQHRRFRRLHVRVVFDRPISGPLCIGGGRFIGLGLFAAAMDGITSVRSVL
ncbi:MAG: type I-U CRISPR-associated protein Cas5/Cas6 [Desulfobacteraceae bacterium]|nr:MAG: type I-U CRISPR-associated protein Cas5/Cas6 [Desulfobacteraceae bacterium]